jgi:hypothetical protein
VYKDELDFETYNGAMEKHHMVFWEKIGATSKQSVQ